MYYLKQIGGDPSRLVWYVDLSGERIWQNLVELYGRDFFTDGPFYDVPYRNPMTAGNPRLWAAIVKVFSDLIKKRIKEKFGFQAEVEVGTSDRDETFPKDYDLSDLTQEEAIEHMSRIMEWDEGDFQRAREDFRHKFEYDLEAITLNTEEDIGMEVSEVIGDVEMGRDPELHPALRAVVESAQKAANTRTAMRTFHYRTEEKGYTYPITLNPEEMELISQLHRSGSDPVYQFSSHAYEGPPNHGGATMASRHELEVLVDTLQEIVNVENPDVNEREIQVADDLLFAFVNILKGESNEYPFPGSQRHQQQPVQGTTNRDTQRTAEIEGQSFDNDSYEMWRPLADLSHVFYCDKSSLKSSDQSAFQKLVDLQQWVEGGGHSTFIKRAPSKRNFTKFCNRVFNNPLPAAQPLKAMCKYVLEGAYAGPGKEFKATYDLQVCVANSLWSQFAQAVGYYEDAELWCDDEEVQGTTSMSNQRTAEDRVRTLDEIADSVASDILDEGVYDQSIDIGDRTHEAVDGAVPVYYGQQIDLLSDDRNFNDIFFQDVAEYISGADDIDLSKIVPIAIFLALREKVEEKLAEKRDEGEEEDEY